MSDGKGGRRPGWSFLFEQVRHDGFSPDDVALILDLIGEICPDGQLRIDQRAEATG